MHKASAFFRKLGKIVALALCGIFVVGAPHLQLSAQERDARAVIGPERGSGHHVTITPNSELSAQERGALAMISPERHVGRQATITLNKSRTFQVSKPFATVVPGSTEIIDVLPATDQSFYVQAKKIGTTNVAVYDNTMRLVGVIDIEVVPDTATLQRNIYAATQSSAIRVRSNDGQIVLTGVAPDAPAAERAVAAAKKVALKGVLNAMKVAPSQQVMLKVRFLEAQRSGSRELGVNWFTGNKNASRVRGINTGLGSGSIASSRTAAGDLPVFQTVATLLSGNQPFGTVLASIVNNNNYSVDVLISALEQKGVVRRLAEPNLIALSGDEAEFLAGGEFPVPVASNTSSGAPTVTIEFKKFGVQLKFTPTVLSNGIINLRIQPEVSQLDYTNAVTVSGFQIPALVTRNAKTTIELRNGQSFAIAGLLETTTQRDISQVPWLGSVPVLGSLFRSPSYRNKESDLVIIVTPVLVAPKAPGQRLATPLDSRIPSNDSDFFILGAPELRKRYVDYVTNGGALRGPYGHMIQPEYGSSKVPNKKLGGQ